MEPFVRVTRDKRGYEHIALMHASARRGRPSKPRTLYVFRTPPGVKVGREPFDESVRRVIEEQNPGVFFDWKKLSHIVPPPPDLEYWREKRRIEKAARQVRREDEQEVPDTPAAVGAGRAADDEAEAASESDAELSADFADAVGSGRGEPPGPDELPGPDEPPGPYERPGPDERRDPDDVERPAPDAPAREPSSPDEVQAAGRFPSPMSPGSPASSVSHVPADLSAAPQPEGHRRRRRRRGGHGRRRPRPDGQAPGPSGPPKVTGDPSKEG